MWESFLNKINQDQMYFQDLLYEVRGIWREDILKIINKVVNNQDLSDYEKYCFIKINKTNIVRDYKIEYLEKKLSNLTSKLEIKNI